MNIRGGAAATLYAAETGGTTVGNPRTTTSAGQVDAWVDEGSYELVVSKSGYTTPSAIPFEAGRGAHAKVVHEAPINVKYPEYGASPSASAATNATALTTAFAAAHDAGGGEVYVPAGVYTYSNIAAQQTLTEVTIFGDGKNATRLQPATNTGRFLLFGGSDVTLRDLAIGPSTISATRTGNAAIECSAVTDMRVENCEVFNTAEIALAFANCSRPKALNNYVHDSKGDGIHFVNCNSGLVCRDNTIKDTGDDLIACWCYDDTESDAMYGAVIDGNHCENGSPGSGVVVGGSFGVAVLNNTIRNTQRPGIRIAAKDEVTTKACRDIRVIGNVVRLGATVVGAGIEVSGWDSGGARIYTHTNDNVIVAHNIVRQAGGTGYILDATRVGTFLGNVNFNSNENNGAFTTHCEVIGCTDLRIADNVMRDDRARTAIAMYLHDLTGCKVGPNVFRGMSSTTYTTGGFINQCEGVATTGVVANWA